MDFFKRLNYSIGNEDWNVEEQALIVNPGDRVVCVTASGDRPLHLLMTECSEIIAIDLNPTQNYLLQLKIAAITHLDYETYFDFLGCRPCSHRISIFNSIKNHLPRDAAIYWSHHRKLIKDGIIYQGRTERLTKMSARLLKIIRPKAIDELFSFTDIEAQKEFISHTWDKYLWRKFFEVLMNPKIMRYLNNDPGITAYVDKYINPGTYFYDRMIDYLKFNLARKSPLLQLVLLGKLLEEALFPYMTYEGHKKIKLDIHRLKYRTGNIIDFLKRENSNSFDSFSMSDIASYMSQENFEYLLRGIYKTAKNNARFCIRKLMCNHFIPHDLLAHFNRDIALEHKLEREETNFVYRFVTGTIKK